MTQTFLIGGYEVTVDDEDAELAAQFTHTYPSQARRGAFYAGKKEGKQGPRGELHRLVLERKLLAEGETFVKHRPCFFVDGDSCNLRRSNLSTQKVAPDLGVRRVDPDSRSGYVGVYLDSHHKTFFVQLRKERKHYKLGYYGRNPEVVAQLYNLAAKMVFGSSATFNQIPTDAPEIPAKYISRLLAKLRKLDLVKS